jgi:integrase
VLVLLTTGCRLGELRALTGAAVHQGYAEIRASWSRLEGSKLPKNDLERVAPLPKVAQETLKFYTGLRGDGLLFTLNGKKPIAERYLASRFADALEAAGIPRLEQKRRRLSLHCLRVTYNSLQIAANTSAEKLRAVVGHLSPEMTSRYTALTPADLAELGQTAERMITDAPAISAEAEPADLAAMASQLAATLEKLNQAIEAQNKEKS